jgi:hypothetical protein
MHNCSKRRVNGCCVIKNLVVLLGWKKKRGPEVRDDFIHSNVGAPALSEAIAVCVMEAKVP